MTYFHDAAIVTAASDEYFPWLLNLIGSVQNNYPGHPQIIVYDLDMRTSFVKELAAAKDVTVKKIPPFVKHWRACYTWKPWVFNDTPARVVYFLDAASEVLRPLTEIFDIIERDGYFCVDQKHAGSRASLKAITSPDLLNRLNLNKDFYGDRICFACGNFGYKKGTVYHECVKEALELAKEGWTLGWSLREQGRNTGRDSSGVVRDCENFRHDQTLLNLLFYKKFVNFKMHNEDRYGAFESRNRHLQQLVWNSRRFNNDLVYLNRLKYKKKPAWRILLNRFYYMGGRY